MKVRDTSPGRLYALSSEIGCVAINGAMAADIPAGGQVVVLALDKKIVIDGDDDAKFVEVRWGTNTVVGSRPVPAWLSGVLAGLVYIVGEANFDINYIPAENKLYLQFSLEVTTEQIEEVNSLLGSVLPSNLVVEMEWIGGMPISYTPVEYLESSGTEYLNTAVLATGDMKITLDFIVVNWGYTCYAFGSNELPQGNIVFTPDYNKAYNRAGRYTYGTQSLYFPMGTHQLDTRYLYVFDRNIVYRNGELAAFFDNESMTEEEFVSKRPMMLFAAQHGNVAMHPQGSKRVWKFVIEQAGTRVLDFIPAVNPEGQPGMYDTVSKVFKVNVGSGDFIIGIETQQQLDNLLNSFPNYTGQAIEKLQINLAEALQTPENEARLAEAMVKNAASPAMISIDMEHTAPKFYAQLTEHGVRRLYHVPRGYTGTMGEYAAANGFKELVETPQPLEGYWNPEWRETETQLICDWVETEPPTEEVIENA